MTRTQRLTDQQIAALLVAHPGWSVDGDAHLTRAWTLPDFGTALALANRIGTLAEALDHHPDLLVGWGRLRVTVWSHDAGGLTARDARLVAEVDALAR